MEQQKKIALVGNPNCGKTTLFNLLTGSRQRVGNWPEVTVEKKTGDFVLNGERLLIIDLPGVYSLLPSSSISEDEKIARDFMAADEVDLVVNIVDSSNLERNLYLTAQLLERSVPMVIALNMADFAKQNGIEIDAKRLSEMLGCPVVPMVASKGKGLEELKSEIGGQLQHASAAPNPIKLPEDINSVICSIASALKSEGVTNSRWLAQQFVESQGDAGYLIKDVNLEAYFEACDKLEEKYDGDVDLTIADCRYTFINKVCSETITHRGDVSKSVTDKIDKIVLNRWLGLPIFLAVMYLMFIFSINVGSAFIDFFDILFGAVFVEGFGELLTNLGAPSWLKTILADGVGGGLQCVSTFIPVIACLFLFLSVLVDSGYMARVAFVMDRLMKALGLPGKAFVPLIVGFGCGVPAIMATRTMEKKSDRITTVLMAPFMSCGARLPVYVLFATAFWPTNGQNLVFALYIIGIAAAIATGFLLKRTVLKDEASTFVIEIPPYHIPTVRNILITTWDRLKGFILKAGKVIVVLVAFLTFLNSVGTDGSFGNEDSDNSVLSAIGKTIVPVFEPMGVSKENWPAAVGIFTGVLAKEAVVGTLDSLYSSMDKAGEAAEDEKEEPFSLVTSFKEALGSISEGFSDVGAFFTDPMGVAVDEDLTNVEEQAKEQEVQAATIGSMNKLFDGQLGAFAYLLMVLLYLPCGAAIGAIYREVGTGWTLFAALWTSAVGYCSATLVYQAGTFAAHPVYSGVCILLSIMSIGLIVFGLKLSVNKKQLLITKVPAAA